MKDGLDVFISYEHESKSIADNIVAVLEQNKIRCWYAPRDVIGDYATSIVEAIERCKIFVIILNEKSSNSIHCLNEVEQAFKANIYSDSKIIIPFKVDNKDLSKAMDYYVKRQHWIDACTRSLDIAVTDLKDKICKILHIEKKPAVEKKRIVNYYVDTSVFEEKRLEKQHLLLQKFDEDIYNALVQGKQNLTVLDVGSNSGSLIMNRLGARKEVKQIIAIEYDQKAIEEGEKNFCEKISFYQADVSAVDFAQRMEQIKQQCGIEKFDIIHCSMLFLHLKSSVHTLKILRKQLAPNGLIYIKDIDDGLNLAYPDPNKNFERVYEICKNNVISGYRHSGREIYTALMVSGFNNIKILRKGLSTESMDYDDKQSLFDIYFSFILEDLRIQSEKYPDDEYYTKEYRWLSSIYEDLESDFLNKEFFFNLGFMCFVAHR